MSAMPTDPDETACQRCLVCGSPRLRPLSRYRSAHLVACRGCGFVFAGRRPSDAELQRHYEHYGTAWHDSPITRQRYREMLDSFEPYRRTNRILDIGCGAGYLLDEAKARGWEPYGTEFSARALELGRERGYNIAQAPLAPDTFAPGMFDVVTALEVVEHLRDLDDEARSLARLVRPGGVLYCTTPNFSALTRRVLGERWGAVDYPEHLCYFTTRTLSDWLGRYGFRAVSVTTTGISPGTIRKGFASPGTARPPARTSDERLREATERSGALQAAKRTINAMLGATRSGDTLKGYFKRT